MLIRYGYEITLNFQQPTALVCLLSVHEDRAADIRVPETTFTAPDVPTSTYRDLFGNRCRRLVAPAGDLTIWGDATISDDGKPDKVLPAAQELPVPELPDDCLAYLMGSRYCETDRLSQSAWDRFGAVAPGWGRVQAICDFVHDHIRFDYTQARSTRTAFEVFHERVGVCRDFAHLAVTLCRCLNIPARYTVISAISASRSSTRWTSVPGWRSSWTMDGTRLIRATIRRVSAGSWLRAAVTRPMSPSSTRSGRTS